MNFIIPPKLAETPPMTPAAVANHLIHLEIQYSLIYITHDRFPFFRENHQRIVGNENKTVDFIHKITMLLETLHHLRPDFPLSF